MDGLRIERRDEVLLLTLNRPERGNALTTDLLITLEEAVRTSREQGARAIVITGAGRNFCSGAETGVVAAPNERDAFVKASWAAIGGLADAPLPVIGAVNGPAVAGGVEVALSCDLRVAHTSAYFQPRGLDWGAVTSSRLARYLPIGLTTQLVWLQEKLGAAEALRWGLVTEVVDSQESLLTSAMVIARRVGRYPTDAVLRSRALLRNLHDSWQRMIELQADATEAGWHQDADASRQAISKKR